MNVLAITQARYHSTRLPAKILMKVREESLLGIHLNRARLSKRISNLIVATTEEDGAEHIVKIARENDLGYFQGSTDDVLSRFYHAALPHNPDYIVRITSDCPLIDPLEIDRVVEECLESKLDYVSNTLKPTLPDGEDVEVFTFKSLTRAYEEAVLKSDREHVTPYIWRNSSFKGGTKFKSGNVESTSDYSDYRLTVDTAEDFEVIRIVIENLGTDRPWLEYVNFLDENQQIRSINQHHSRNEGYSNSLLND